ncbi:hypothetical protein GS538_20385 [Rhodococcus hoagii]|nr:hypothetical protein [Prescottella equi]NKR94286.1 hypothetical protein [Prescottella equi]
MTTAAFTADATAFVRLVETAAVFGSNDDTLPMLCAVRLERHGNQLVAAATDRFRLGVVRIAAQWDDAAPADWATTISRDDVAQIVTSFKNKGQSRREAKITVAAQQNTELRHRVVGQLVISKAGSPITLTVETLESEFPKWRQLIQTSTDAADQPSPERTAILNLDLLKTFDKAKWSTNDSLTIEYPADPTRPVVITCGHHFLGIQMPLRTNERAEWDDILTTAQPGRENLGLPAQLAATA